VFRLGKGHPVITFSGAFRPFTLGVRKASIVLEKLAELKHFVENNKRHLGTADNDIEPQHLPFNCTLASYRLSRQRAPNYFAD
jgi:hypothetical protein